MWLVSDRTWCFCNFDCQIFGKLLLLFLILPYSYDLFVFRCFSKNIESHHQSTPLKKCWNNTDSTRSVLFVDPTAFDSDEGWHVDNTWYQVMLLPQSFSSVCQPNEIWILWTFLLSFYIFPKKRYAFTLHFSKKLSGLFALFEKNTWVFFLAHKVTGLTWFFFF